MNQSPPSDVTLLLKRLSNGDQDALAQLIPLIYDELHRLAAFHLQRERIEHTLQTTALVNEVFLKLAQAADVTARDRAHFLAICAGTRLRLGRERGTGP